MQGTFLFEGGGTALTIEVGAMPWASGSALREPRCLGTQIGMKVDVVLFYSRTPTTNAETPSRITRSAASTAPTRASP
jgi:hypothetical protein